MNTTAVACSGWESLQARGLSLQRGERVLFNGLDFDLAAGELILLTGPNGSGKSSLLRALIGLTPLSAGHCTLSTCASNGERVSASVSGAQLRGLALYQGHASAVKGELSALENLALNSALDAPIDSARLDGAQHREPPMVGITEADLMRALTTVGLRRQHAIEARRLSQGQRQRLQLARFALGLESDARPVWLMDEPSAALDDAGTQVLQDLLDAHLQRGGGALIATHLPLAVKAGQRRGLALQDWAPARERTALRDRALTA